MNTSKAATERTYDEDLMPLLREMKRICGEMRIDYLCVFDLHDAGCIGEFVNVGSDGHPKIRRACEVLNIERVPDGVRP